MALSRRLQSLNRAGDVSTHHYIKEDEAQITKFSEAMRLSLESTVDVNFEIEKLGDNLFSLYDKTLLHNQFINDLKEYAKDCNRSLVIVDWFNNNTEKQMKDIVIAGLLEGKEPYFIVLPNPKYFMVMSGSQNDNGVMNKFHFMKPYLMDVSVLTNNSENGDDNWAEGIETVTYYNLMEKFRDLDNILEFKHDTTFNKRVKAYGFSSFSILSYNHMGCFVNAGFFGKGFSIPLPETEYPTREVTECIITPSVPYSKLFTANTFGQLFKFLKDLPNKEGREIVRQSNKYISYMHGFFERLKETNKQKIKVTLTDISQLRQAVFNKEKEARELETLNKSLIVKITKQMTKDLDLKIISREFEKFTKKFKMINLDMSDRIVGITNEIEIEYPNESGSSRNIYLLGEFEISVFFTGNLTIKNLTRRILTYDHPHVNDTIPCLGTIARLLPQLIMDGGFLSVLDMMYDFLCSYANRDGYTPFHQIHNWPVKVAQQTEEPVREHVGEAVMETHDPLSGVEMLDFPPLPPDMRPEHLVLDPGVYHSLSEIPILRSENGQADRQEEEDMS